jgi:phosphoglycolate phosphatase-like HAD superfamily hydrolase
MDTSKIKVCIFDVNGVLIDSNMANARAMAQAFTDDSPLQQSIIELYLNLSGIDRGRKIRIIQDQIIGTPFRKAEFELRWKNFIHLGRLAMLDAPLFEGCKEVLLEIGKLKLTRVALSNTPLAELREILAAQNLESLLDVIRGGGDWPKSESLTRLLEEFQFAPSECIFFGDGKGDLAAARHAGISFAAIDPGRGEFDAEQDFTGPYKSLAHWRGDAMGLQSLHVDTP